MKLCQHAGCTKAARYRLGWRVWATKADKLKGDHFGVLGMLDVVVCEDHVPETAKEILTEEGKAMVNKEFTHRRLPWPKWSTAVIVTEPV